MSFFVGARDRVYVNADGSDAKTLFHIGGDTLYYGTSAVTSTVNEGSLASGASLAMTQGKWLLSAGQSRVLTGALDSGGGGSTLVLNVGNLGSSYAASLVGQHSVDFHGTLNANCALTISGMPAGSRATLFLTQDATGGRTLSINGTAVSGLGSTAGATYVVYVVGKSSADQVVIVA